MSKFKENVITLWIGLSGDPNNEWSNYVETLQEKMLQIYYTVF
jgi:hypothetical protein